MNIAEFLKQFGQSVNPVDCLFCLVGLALLVYWALQNRWGTRALRWSRPRRNNMPVYIAFGPFFIWVLAVATASALMSQYIEDISKQKQALANNITMGIIEIVIIAIMIRIGYQCFSKRLNGLGFKPKTIAKDIGWATVNLVAIWPVLVTTVLLSTHIGKMLYGPDYQLQQHDELKLLMENPSTALITSVVLMTIVIAPIFEEMMFRGLIQTLFRSYLRKPWPAILLTSALFAIIHENTGHWPALFTLAMCLGYSYEKSGSLLRPILIHMLFNATSVIATLLSVSQ